VGLAHRRKLTLDDLTLYVGPVEYVILRKLEYYREGNSEKHLRDIRGMLESSPAQIDRTFLDDWIQRLGLAAEWHKAQSGTDRRYGGALAIRPTTTVMLSSPPRLLASSTRVAGSRRYQVIATMRSSSACST